MDFVEISYAFKRNLKELTLRFEINRENWKNVIFRTYLRELNSRQLLIICQKVNNVNELVTRLKENGLRIERYLYIKMLMI